MAARAGKHDRTIRGAIGRAAPRAVPRAGLLAILLAVAAVQGCGDNTGPVPVGSLEGRVTDIETGNPVDGAAVTIAGHSTQSDAAGAYRLDGLPAGQQSLTATHPDYQIYTADVTISSPGVATLDVALHPGTGTPDALTRLSASSGPTAGSVRLEWETVSHAFGYNIYWSTSPGVTPATGTKIPQVASPYVHSGLTPGVTYYYVITGIGNVAESAPSPEVHAIARGSIEVQLVSPTAAGFVDTIVSAEATITTAFALSAVTARIGTVSAPMTFDAAAQRWRAQLSLAALASPATVLVQITAQDVNGNLGDGSVSARFDRHPALAVTDPFNGVVVRPTAALRVTCTDDSPAGCPSVTVVEAETQTVLFSGQGSLNTTFSLAQFDGRQVFLEIRATDGAGQVTVVRRYAFVETSPGLTQAANGGSGIVVDADAGRLLVINSTRWVFDDPGGDTVRVVDRLGGGSTTVFTAESTTADARLTPLGAFLITQRSHSPSTQVRELRNGTLSTLADVDFIYDWEVAGGFAAWLEFDNATWRLMWRDLVTGTSQQVTTGVLNGSVDLAPNGDLVFAKGGEIYRFSGGATQQVTANAAAGLYALDAGTDGSAIVQTVRPAPCCVGLPLQTILLDPGGDVVLASVSAAQQSLDYLLNGGWIAFTRYDLGGVPQVWARSPAGTETQLGFLGSASAPRLVNSNGEVIFGLYRASPSAPATQFLYSSAQPIYIDGALYVMFGALLFRVG